MDVALYAGVGQTHGMTLFFRLILAGATMHCGCGGEVAPPPVQRASVSEKMAGEPPAPLPAPTNEEGPGCNPALTLVECPRPRVDVTRLRARFSCAKD
jgi:hypothetical protein